MRYAILSFAFVVGLTTSLTGASAQSTPPATATTPAAAPAAAVASNTSDPALDQIVCKSMAPTTGSRIGTRRICQTQRQWAAEEREMQSYVTHEQTRGLLFSTPAN